MCFVKKGQKTFTAESDIEVYKVFRKVSHFRMLKHYTYYTGPYRSDFIYDELNGEYHCEDFGKQVESGWIGFHSFKNYQDAVAFMDSENRWASKNETYEIIPCIIPKDSLYLEGTFINVEAYVSNKIVLNY